MTRDHTNKASTEDDIRTEQAKKVLKEQIESLRELLRWLRNKMN